MKFLRPGLLPVAVLASVVLPAREVPWPGAEWARAEPREVGMDPSRLEKAGDYALTGGGSGMIIRRGKLVMAWGDPKRRYDLKSTTKSIGVTALGLALLDGKVRLDDPAVRHHPSLAVPPETNRDTGWIEKITLEHLATHTAGFEKPGGYTALRFAPGTRWAYSDGGPNWLAECITLLYRRDLRDLLFDRVFTRLGIGREDLTWRKNAYRPEMINGIPRREFGSGVHANVDAMARIGYLYLHRGKWRDSTVIPESFVRLATRSHRRLRGLPVEKPESYFRAPDHYGLLWWNNADGTLPRVPRDAFWSWGLYDSLIIVFPGLDVVAARAGSGLGGRGADYGRIAPFLEAIAAAVTDGSARTGESAAPCPPSPVIASVRWADAATIVRRARGGDNWPVTWGDDDLLYTAYGDGQGFEPRVPSKLSLGFARVRGSPPDFRGENIRSPTGERRGDGPAGEKASGLLMLRGVLYLWARNASNSRLAWSHDRGKTWTWSPWRFTTSFGHPTFLNFGKNYADARDGFVYIYSHDADSAYEPADRMVLARVAAERIRDREAYEFFRRLDERGRPLWTREVAQRGAVFEHPRRCYRSAVTHDAALRRYLWCQIIPGEDTRFRGGFGIYDAPEPWGPWTTVYFTEQWDVGPGENASFPTRWMSADGKTLHLVFSGEDCFSVRRATLTLRRGD